jgi:LysR family carnitine catabolism transcriptional activator
MDLRQLGYVVAVVDHGSFTRAAEAAGVTQPSLSQGVRALEAELGVALFHRARGHVRLTAAGEALIEPARQALRDAETARAAVAEVSGNRAGRLDLVCLPSLAVDPAAALVGQFRQLHPGVAVRLDEPEDADAVAHLVRTGTSELGLTELPSADDLHAVSLEDQDYVAVLPATDGDASPRASVTLAALARRPMITTPPGTSTRRLLDEAFAAASITPTITVETDHREVIVPLVAAGAGVSVLPRRRTTAAWEAGITTRAIEPPITRRIGLVHRPGPLSPAALAFARLAAPDHFGSQSRPRPRRR